MSDPFMHQVRVTLGDDVFQLARHEAGHPALRPLTDVLSRHHATIKSQFDAFAEYLGEVEANGETHLPLYKWTRATIEDPVKRETHMKVFAIHVGGETLYPKAAADALEADLQPLVGGGLVTRLSRHDTNPATTMPVPAEYRS